MYTLEELIDLLLKVKQLPTLNPVMVMVVKMLNEEEPDVHRISKVLSDDPSMTGMLLKVANSAMYGGRCKIATVQDSVVRLGLKEVRKLVVDISVVNYVAKMPKGRLDPIEYWEHSIAVAICMEEIHQLTRVLDTNGPQSHVVGLLHDIGRLICATHLQEAYRSLPDDPEELGGNDDIVELERESLGIDHSQIGAAVLEHWGIPLKIVNCIRYHHEPDVCPKEQRKETWLLTLSDSICRMMKIGCAGEGALKEIDQELWEKLELSPAIQDEIMKKIRARIKKSEVLLHISGMKR
ncbi:MAG: HDOD domain-containing protein [Candidatus Glassbacteria bacterium]|nr:HDOD domain-containing protein [Candidatus Glassbacteria bacterium]